PSHSAYTPLFFLYYSAAPRDLHSFPTRRFSDLGVDGAGLQRLIGFASFRDIHPRDLVYQTGEVAAGQLAMNDGPDHASLLTTLRDRKSTRLTPVTFRSRMPSSA